MKKWRISEGLFFEETPNGAILNYEPDEQQIIILEKEIKDMIEKLSLMKSHFETKRLTEIDAARLTQWGNEKTPGENYSDWIRMIYGMDSRTAA